MGALLFVYVVGGKPRVETERDRIRDGGKAKSYPLINEDFRLRHFVLWFTDIRQALYLDGVPSDFDHHPIDGNHLLAVHVV